MANLKPMQVGDRVAIRKSSQYYGRNPRSNPADEPGTITRLQKTRLEYWVQWDNGGVNSYSREDLRYWKGAPKRKREKADPVDFNALIEKAKATVTKGTRTAHYAFIYNDGKIKENDNHACHAQVLHTDGSKVHSIVTLIRRKKHTAEQQEVCKRYMTWLIERSPWSQAFVGTGEEAWESWFAVATSNCPGNILQGGLIASRQTQENFERVVLWDKLVSQGLPENDSFALASCLHLSGEDVVLSFHHGGHYPLNPYIMGRDGFKAFCEGRPVNITELFCKKGQARDVHNAFWGYKGLEPAINAFIKEAGQETKAVTNPFKKAKATPNRKSVSLSKFAALYLEKGI